MFTKNILSSVLGTQCKSKHFNKILANLVNLPNSFGKKSVLQKVNMSQSRQSSASPLVTLEMGV